LAAVLSGRNLARRIEAEVLQSTARWEESPPGLAVLLVGDDPASRGYVRSKEKACARTGIRSVLFELPEDSSQEEVLSRIAGLNSDDSIDAILCQLPLPAGISAAAVASAIDPAKDVDGFHPQNVGRLWRGEDCLVPCTPAGIMILLADAGISPEGRRAVVLGRSIIVGRPMAALLLAANATVTIAHSRTPDLPSLCRTADILVSAVGVPGIIRGGWVGDGAVVIDVGTTYVDGVPRGDVSFDEVEPAASFITPVPGGVGPLTIAMLMKNTARCRLARKTVTP
jgi:methylenetetrahydrofolate dehydrogenase (NADP+)/methenyltetrahydrofolate cyclohydrolase